MSKDPVESCRTQYSRLFPRFLLVSAVEYTQISYSDLLRSLNYRAVIVSLFKEPLKEHLKELLS